VHAAQGQKLLQNLAGSARRPEAPRFLDQVHNGMLPVQQGLAVLVVRRSCNARPVQVIWVCAVFIELRCLEELI